MSESNPTPEPRQLSLFAFVIEIPLSQDKTALVDEIDSDLFTLGWYAHKSSKTYYADRIDRDNGGKKTIRMHRVILARMLGRELDAHEQPDHVDGNGLNNRRSNLRLATKKQNARNRQLRSDNQSGFKGVSFDKKTKRWKAQINNDERQIVLGYFDTAKQAHFAYCEAAKTYHGEFARFS